MATTYNDNGGNTPNGSHLNFTYTFPVIKNEDVKVALNGSTQATTKYAVNTSVNPTRIEFNNTSIDSKVQESTGAPKTGVLVRVFRDTGLEDPADRRVTYQAGSAIRAQDLNNMYDHLIFSTQERQNQPVQNHMIAEDSVTNAKIKDDSIDSEHYIDGSIDTAHIADGAVTSAKLDTNINIAGDFRVAGQITADADLNLQGDNHEFLIENAAGDNKFSVDSDNGNTWINGTLTVVGDTTLANNSIGTAEIADSAVTNAKLANDAVTTEKLNGAAVTNAKLANDAVTTEKLNGAAVTEAKLANDAVTTAKLNGSAVTTAKIADDAITGDKLADNSISSQHILNDQVGSTKIADNAVQTAHITDTAVSTTKIADSAVTSAKIADSAITEVKLGSSVVTTAKINNGAVTNAKLASDAVDGAKLAADSVQESHITAGGTAGADKVLVYDSSEATNWKWADQSGSGGGGEITVQDEGSSLTTAATTLNFVGAGVVASGTGASKTITISGSGGSGVTTDFQYLELKAHNNVSGAFSAGSADYELVTKGTNTAVTPTQAAALLISVGGVTQQPNTGTSIGSNDGFCIDGSSIHFGANLAEHPEYILYLKGAGEVTVLADDSVTTAKIADNNVTGAKIALGSDAAGDIMYYNGTDYVRLAKGTNGHYLKQGTSNAPEWSTVTSDTDTTYSISCVDGDNTDEEKIRLTAGGSGSGTDDVILEAGTNLSVARSGDKITFTNTVGGATGLDFNDDVKVRFGTGNDLEIYHNGTSNYVESINGVIHLRSNSGMQFDTTGSGNTWLKCNTSDASSNSSTTNVELYYNNSKKFETLSSGAKVWGDLHLTNSMHIGDGEHLRLGNGNDLDIYHDGTDSRIHNTAGRLVQRTATSAEWYDSGGNDTLAKFTVNGGCEFYHDDSLKFKTTSNGMEISGIPKITAGNALELDNGFNNKTAKIVNSEGSGTSDLRFSTGSTPTENFRITASGNAWLPNDNGKLICGAGDDLKIYHNGTDSYIESATGALRIGKSDNNRITDAADNTIIGTNATSAYLAYDGNTKFETTSTGVQVTGKLFFDSDNYLDCNTTANTIEYFLDGSQVGEWGSDSLKLLDSKQLKLGDSSDFKIWHSGNDSIIQNTTGSLFIQTDNDFKVEAADGGKDIIHGVATGSVELGYDGNVTLETHSAGILVGVVGSTQEIWFPDSNDSDVGIIRYRHDEDWMSLFTWGSERFRIEDNGDLYGQDTTISPISSDSRLKKNVADYNYDLAKFKQLRPRTFEWINTSNHEHPTGTRKGFIAQEVETVDASLTMEVLIDEANTADRALLDADGKNKSVRLGSNDALYVSVIQQLITKIETLETKVAALEAA